MNTIQQIRNVVLSLVLLTCLNGYANAIDTAPRISDREIIEGLANLHTKIVRLEAGQQVLNQRIDSVNARFDSVNARIDSLKTQTNQRFDSLETQTNQRFDSLETQTNQRFDDMNNRINDSQNIMIAILISIFGLIGLIVWDRRTAIKPLEQKMSQVEQDLIRIDKDIQLQLQSTSTTLTALNAFRNLAKNNKEVADVLRQFQLT